MALVTAFIATYAARLGVDRELALDGGMSAVTRLLALRKNSESQTGRADRRWLASPSCCCYVTCHVSRMALSSTARDRASSIAL